MIVYETFGIEWTVWSEYLFIFQLRLYDYPVLRHIAVFRRMNERSKSGREVLRIYAVFLTVGISAVFESVFRKIGPLIIVVIRTCVVLDVNCTFRLAVDGDFGNKTLEAVKDYQKVNGLVVDGIVGVKTWEKLNER